MTTSKPTTPALDKGLIAVHLRQMVANTMSDLPGTHEWVAARELIHQVADQLETTNLRAVQRSLRFAPTLGAARHKAGKELDAFVARADIGLPQRIAIDFDPDDVDDPIVVTVLWDGPMAYGGASVVTRPGLTAVS